MESNTNSKLPNGGRFQKGYDPRRHKFTTAELRAGYRSALINIASRSGISLRFAKKVMQAVINGTEIFRQDGDPYAEE